MKLESPIYLDDLPQETISQRKAADIIGVNESTLRGYIKAGKITKPPVYTEEWALGIKAQLEQESANGVTPALFDDSLSGAPEGNTKEKAPTSDAGAIKKQSQFTGDYTRQQRYSTELDKATDALRFISPDLSREDWVRVAMALKSEFGEDGFPPFDNWSMGGKSYKANDTKDTWQSVDGSGGVKIGTLYHMAKQAGWGGTGVSTHSDIARDFQPINREPKSPNESQQQSDVEKHAKAAEKARDLIAAATPVASENNHPYLLAKGVSVSGAMGLYVLPLPDFQGIAGYYPRGKDGELTGPLLLAKVEDVSGAVSTVELIGANGQKSALSGGKKSGCFWLAQDIASDYTGLVYVAEGIATALSIKQATGKPAIATLTQGNLIKTANAVKAKAPSASIIIACDLVSDTKKPDSKLLDAIRQGGFSMVWPEFTDQAGYTDFNDMHQKEGIAATAARLGDFSSGAEWWPNPEPLLGANKATPYPVDALPQVIGDAVREVQAYVKAPMALVAGCALSALSIACQGLFNVSRNGMTPVPASLYLLTVADSGERKTSTEGYFFQAFSQYEREIETRLQAEKQERDSRIAAWSMTREGILSLIKKEASKGGDVEGAQQKLLDHDQVKPEPLKMPKYMVGGDVTPEGLARAIGKQWPSRGVVSSEAGTFFGSHAMGNDSITRTLSFFNTLWDGKPYEVTRSGNAGADSYTIHSARLTLSLQVQAATLQAFFEKNGHLARGTGFLARFLIAWPETTQGTRYILETDKAPSAAIARFSDHITRLLQDDSLQSVIEGEHLEPKTLLMSDEANKLWVDHHNVIESQLSPAGELESIRDVASKAAENTARLAALFHAIEGGGDTIGRDSVAKAAKVSAWYLVESLRFFSEIALPEDTQRAVILEKWLIDYCNKHHTGSVPKSEVSRKCPSKVRDKEKIDNTIEKLSNMGRARLIHEGGKQVIQVNPALLSIR